jgi:hypothetical protein
METKTKTGNTLHNLLYASGFLGGFALISYWVGKVGVLEVKLEAANEHIEKIGPLAKFVGNSEIEKLDYNQSLILLPAYLHGDVARGYILLTDLDSDGKWDIAEKCIMGFTTGSGEYNIYFKEGYGPSQVMKVPFSYVKPEFFEPYQ